MVKREAENARVPAATIELLRSVAEQVAPSDPSLADWYANYQRQHRKRFAVDVEMISATLPQGAKLLEYGCSPPILTGVLAARGFAVSGLDVAPERFADSLERIGADVRRCDVETEATPFEDGAFDAVVFNEIFEHLRINPIFTMEQVFRVLRPGGLLFLSTPNLRSLRGLKNLLLHNEAHTTKGGIYRQYEKLRTLGHMGHVREYTTKEVGDFLERLGFRVARVVYRGGHGRGAVGLVERLAPSLRPSFSIVAEKQVRSGAVA